MYQAVFILLSICLAMLGVAIVVFPQYAITAAPVLMLALASLFYAALAD
jgi:uncharacterized membrane protein YczE